MTALNSNTHFRVLLLNPSNMATPRLTDILIQQDQRVIVDIHVVETIELFKTALINCQWDAVLVSPPSAADVAFLLRTRPQIPPMIVLCKANEESRVFSWDIDEVTDVVLLDEPERLMFAFKKILRQRQTHATQPFISTPPITDQYLQRIEIMHRIDRGIIEARSIETLVETTLNSLRELVPCQRVSILLFDKTPTENGSHEATIFAVNENRPLAQTKGSRILFSREAYEAQKNDRVVTDDDMRLLIDEHLRYKDLIAEGLLSALHIALESQGELIGSLNFFANTPHYFTDTHKEIGSEIAAQLSIAIKQLLLSEEVSRQNEDQKRYLTEIYEINSALQQSEMRYRSVVEDQIDLICRYDTNMTLTFVNQAYADAYGMEPIAMIGKSILTFMPPEDHGWLTTHLKSLNQANPVASNDYYSQLNDRTYRWYQWTNRALFDEVGNFIEYQGVARDITDRKNLQLQQQRYTGAVEEVRQFLQTALDTFPANTAILTPDGIIMNVNAPWIKFAQEHGAASSNAYLGYNYLTVCDNVTGPDVKDAAYVAMGIREVIGGISDRFSAEYKMEGMSTPSWFKVEVTPFQEPTPRRVVIAHIDITDRKIAEESLREALELLEQHVDDRTAELQATKERVEAILNHSLEGIIFIQPDLSIQLTNTAFNEMFDCKPDDYLGKSLLSIIHPDDASLFIQTINSDSVKQTGTHLELIALCPNGTPFDAELSIGFIKGDGIVCTIADITERKYRERQLRYHASVQESVSEAVIVTDLDFHIRSWNSAAESIYGYQTEDIMGLTPEILRTQFNPKQTINRFIKDFFQAGQWHGEAVQYRQDGTPIDVQASMTLLKNERGTTYGIVAVVRDITEQKRTEEALKAYADEISEMYNSAPIGYHSLDANGTYLQINDTELCWLGYTRDEIIGKMKWGDLLTPKSQSYFATNFAIFKEKGEIRDLEFEVLTKDGRLISVLLSAVAVYDSDHNFLMSRSTFYDITDRKKAEQALQVKMDEDREFQNHLKLLHDITIELTEIDTLDTFYRRTVELGLQHLGFERLALFLYDPASEQAIGTYGTDTVGKLTDERHLRFRPDRPEGLFNRTLNDADRFFYAEQINLYTEMDVVGEGWNAAAILWSGTDNLGWLVADNAITHQSAKKSALEVLSLYALTLGTLLAQKRTMNALRDSENRYRLLADNINDAITRTNLVGEYLYVSPSVRTLFGYEPHELLGKQWRDFIHPEDLEKLAPTITPDQSRPAQLPAMSYRMRHKNGDYIWTESTAQAVYAPDTNKIVEFVTASRDITERKRVEETLKQAVEKEKELGDLKSRFVSMASHEFRTPLATILAATETLGAYRSKMSEDQIEMRLTKIREQVGYLKDIMEDVLLLAQMQARRVEFNPSPVNLNELVQNVIDEYQNHPDSTHQLIYTGTQDSRILMLDKKLMRQILSNLISNAVKYSPSGKPVVIYLDYVGPNMTISVRDEGIGIPDSDQPRLFEPFHRANNVGSISGTGLGLVITKESVELHGGTIHVDSKVGVGTCFTISIPLSLRTQT